MTLNTDSTNTSDATIDLSVVVPAYNEAGNVAPLISELTLVLEEMGGSFEIIVVNDGSTDETMAELKSARQEYPHLRVVDLSRNFGQTPAIMAGFDLSRGRVIATMDADLQNDPHDIPHLIERLNQGFDLVSGWRRKRQDGWLLRILPSIGANWIIARTLALPLHDYGCTLKVYRRELLSDLNLYGEMHRFIPAIAGASSDRIAELEVNHRARVRGLSKYGLSRTFKVLLDLVFMIFLSRFRTNPIRFFGILGLLSAGAGILSLLQLLYMKITHEVDMTGNPLLIVTVVFILVAVQLISIGILAEINVRTYYESQDKKTYSIREILG